MEDQTPARHERFVPLEKREVRGLTIQYITQLLLIIGACMGGYLTLKKTIESQGAEIIKLKEEKTILQKDVETLKINQTTTEIWKARWEEKFNR